MDAAPSTPAAPCMAATKSCRGLLGHQARARHAGVAFAYDDASTRPRMAAGRNLVEITSPAGATTPIGEHAAGLVIAVVRMSALRRRAATIEDAVRGLARALIRAGSTPWRCSAPPAHREFLDRANVVSAGSSQSASCAPTRSSQRSGVRLVVVETARRQRGRAGDAQARWAHTPARRDHQFRGGTPRDAERGAACISPRIARGQCDAIISPIWRQRRARLARPRHHAHSDVAEFMSTRALLASSTRNSKSASADRARAAEDQRMLQEAPGRAGGAFHGASAELAERLAIGEMPVGGGMNGSTSRVVEQLGAPSRCRSRRPGRPAVARRRWRAGPGAGDAV